MTQESKTTDDRPEHLWLIAGVALLAGIFGSTEPTGSLIIDALWREGATLAIGFSITRTPWNIRILAFALCATVASTPIGLIAGAVWFAKLAYEKAAYDSDGQKIRKAVEIIAASTLLFSLTDRFIAGSATLAAGASITLLVGYSISQSQKRTVVRLAAVSVVVAGAFALLGGFYFQQMLGGVDSLATQVRQVSATDGLPEQTQIESLANSLHDSRSTADSWYFRPLEVVPAAGKNIRVARNLLTAGDQIAVGAAASIRNIQPDLEIDVRATTPADLCNGLDLLDDQLIDHEEDLFLAPQLQDALRRATDFQDTIQQGRDLCPAVAQLADSFRSSDTSQQLVLFSTTAEARGTIGLVTNWAGVTFGNGSVQLAQSGRSIPVNDRLSEVDATLTLPPDAYELWGEFSLNRFFQDITLSPDATLAADVALDLMEQIDTDTTYDGVFMVGPAAIAALVDACDGISVTVPGSTEPAINLSGSNAVDFLVRDQYDLGASYGERVELLDLLTATLVAKLEGGDCLGSVEAAESLVDAVYSGELLYVPADDQTRQALESSPLLGDLPEADDVELFGIVEQNSGLDKLDPYLAREASLQWSDEASASPELSLTYRSDLPEFLPQYVLGEDHGTAPLRVNRRRVSIYAPAKAVEVTAAGVSLEVQSNTENGHQVSTFLLDVPPGEPVDVTISFEQWDAPDGLTILQPPSLNEGNLVVGVGDALQEPHPGNRISQIRFLY